MTELDKAIDALREERADIMAEIDAAERRVGIIDAELRGMERARELFVPQVAEERLTRHAAQKPIMDLFERTQDWWTEAKIVEATGLPLESVHRFLLRAVQNGKLQQRPQLAPGEPIGYELPPRQSLTGAREAAQ